MRADRHVHEPTTGTRAGLAVLSLCLLTLPQSGCETTPQAESRRPDPPWPRHEPHPAPQGRTHMVQPAPPPTPALGARPWHELSILPRARWAETAPNPDRLQRMGRITRITVHHEGYERAQRQSLADTAARLRRIRAAHVRRMGAGDVGYHFLIDRDGRIWRGRPIRYRGAHVEDHNRGNVGVVVLGNFEKQRLNSAQRRNLRTLLEALRTRYDVPTERIDTHRELGATQCPGHHLQGFMERLRK
jgi:hypothetical protein